MRRPKRGSVKFHIGEVELTQVGTKSFDLGDPYHLAITMSWGAFFASCLAIDIVVNFVFALLYMLQPHAVANVAPGSLSDAFFFSVETLATVSYGVMAPASTYGHIVASCELTCGLAFTALVTGLIFVRFSRIKAKVAFADKVVIARHDGHPTLMIRVAYDRAGSLADAEARATFMRFMRTTEGRSFRHSEELVLTRSRLALLVLTWTIMHEIDTASPLSGLTTEKLVETDARLIVTIKARNMAAGAEVFDMAVYTAEQILFGMNYQDVVTSGDATHINADLRKLNLVEPDIEPDAS